ncbi:MAG: DUF4270 domain-containing protein [Prevotella sp.]|jgi:hypothetical protein
MNAKYIAGLALAALTLISCDDTTDTIGQSLVEGGDVLEIGTDTFVVTTQSVVADSVLSRNTTGYLGKIKDPETGAYVTGDFMTQFHVIEDYNLFMTKDSIMSKWNGNIAADSCKLVFYYSSFYGDSLASMKARAYEMSQPMTEGVNYYTDFDPMKEGLIREDGFAVDKVYSITNLSLSTDERYASDYVPYFSIPLNDPYTDKDGVTYNNFGTYLMRMYYNHPEYFKNSVALANHVLPGVFIKYVSGLGSMAYINSVRLLTFYDYQQDDSIGAVYSSLDGTEEVLQTSTITNDEGTINRLAADNSCTYLKTPAGIFTEVTFPVDEILGGTHANDSINTARLVLQRINSETTSDYALDPPSTLLILPKDSLYSFFENKEITNSRYSFLATYDSSDNTYTFNNISGLVKFMKQKEGQSEDWNKAIVVPVSTTTTTVNSTTYLTSVVHDMSLTSTRLVGGTATTRPVKLSVIYSKFQ